MTTTEKARVLLADCPWDYQNWTEKKNGAARSHYETMKVEDICALPVSDWTDKKGCVLGLWATFPKLREAFRVMDAWGFEYVTGWPWIKITRGDLEALPQSKAIVKTGIGFWAQGTAELFLIGRRGSIKRNDVPQVKALWINRDGAPDSELAEDRVLYHPIGEHSVKPVGVHDYLADRFDGPRVELFAAREREGWACYGRGTGYELSASGIAKLPATAAADAVHAALGGKPKAPSLAACEWCGYAADAGSVSRHVVICLKKPETFVVRCAALGYGVDGCNEDAGPSGVCVAHRDLKPENVLSIAGVADF